MAKIKITLFITLVLALLPVLCSCNSNPENMSNGDTPENKLNGDTLESTYHFSKEVVPAESVLNIRQVYFPPSINDYKVSVFEIYSDSKFIVVLYNEDVVPVDKEIGLYDLKAETYETVWQIPENVAFGIETFNEEYLVLKTTEDVSTWSDAKLWALSFKTKELVEIHNYNPEYPKMSKNAILLDGRTLYFDDVETEGDEMEIHLFSYDFMKGETKLVQEHAQNPMKFKDEILVITRDDTGRYSQITSLHGKSDFSITFNRLSELQAAYDAMYAKINKHTDHIEKFTVWSIVNMINNEEILETENSISDLQVNRHFVSWMNFTKDIPYIYNLDQGRILAFKNVDKGYHTFILGENDGLLSTTTDYVQTYYYYFSYDHV